MRKNQRWASSSSSSYSSYSQSNSSRPNGIGRRESNAKLHAAAASRGQLQGAQGLMGGFVQLKTELREFEGELYSQRLHARRSLTTLRASDRHLNARRSHPPTPLPRSRSLSRNLRTHHRLSPLLHRPFLDLLDPLALLSLPRYRHGPTLHRCHALQV